MPFAALVLQLDSDDAERLSAALLDAGALSVDLADAQAGTPDEKALFDEPGEEGTWVRLELTALFSGPADAAQRMREACEACGMEIPPHSTRSIGDEDWVRRSQQQFGPIQISSRLWIVPSWHQPPDPAAVNVLLDPGTAFGTGSHATTRLCLRWLEKSIVGGEALIDYGCGSGILAIAGMRLGAHSAVGVDIDPEALTAARFNAARNGVAVRFVDPDTRFDCTADLVVANILANPIKLLAPLLAPHCRKGGRVALSGILAPQAPEIREAYAPWFMLDDCAEDEGWICLSGARR